MIPYWLIGKSDTKGGGGASFVSPNEEGNNVYSTMTMQTDGGSTVNKMGITNEQMELIKKYGLIAGAIIVVVYILRG